MLRRTLKRGRPVRLIMAIPAAQRQWAGKETDAAAKALAWQGGFP